MPSIRDVGNMLSRPRNASFSTSFQLFPTYRGTSKNKKHFLERFLVLYCTSDWAALSYIFDRFDTGSLNNEDCPSEEEQVVHLSGKVRKKSTESPKPSKTLKNEFPTFASVENLLRCFRNGCLVVKNQAFSWLDNMFLTSSSWSKVRKTLS